MIAARHTPPSRTQLTTVKMGGADVQTLGRVIALSPKRRDETKRRDIAVGGAGTNENISGTNWRRRWRFWRLARTRSRQMFAILSPTWLPLITAKCGCP